MSHAFTNRFRSAFAPTLCIATTAHLVMIRSADAQVPPGSASYRIVDIALLPGETPGTVYPFIVWDVTFAESKGAVAVNVHLSAHTDDEAQSHVIETWTSDAVAGCGSSACGDAPACAIVSGGFGAAFCHDGWEAPQECACGLTLLTSFSDPFAMELNQMITATLVSTAPDGSAEVDELSVQWEGGFRGWYRSIQSATITSEPAGGAKADLIIEASNGGLPYVPDLGFQIRVTAGMHVDVFLKIPDIPGRSPSAPCHLTCTDSCGTFGEQGWPYECAAGRIAYYPEECFCKAIIEIEVPLGVDPGDFSDEWVTITIEPLPGAMPDLPIPGTTQVFSIPPTKSCPADLNGDGVVDGADLGILLGSWGRSNTGDLNGDGAVDGADLGILLGAWGACG